MAASNLNPAAETPSQLKAVIAAAYKKLNTKLKDEVVVVDMAAGRAKPVITKADADLLIADAREMVKLYTSEEIVNQVEIYRNSYFLMRIDGNTSKALHNVKAWTETNWSGGLLEVFKVLAAINLFVYSHVKVRTGLLGTNWEVWYKGVRVNAANLQLEPGSIIWFISATPYASGVSRWVKQGGGRAARKPRKKKSGVIAGPRRAKGKFDSLIVGVRKRLQAQVYLRQFKIKAAEFRWTRGTPPARTIGHARKIAISMQFYPQKLVA